MSEKCELCEELKERIEFYKGLLREAYPPRRLQVKSTYGLLIFGGSLILSFAGGFNLLHPILAGPMFISSLIFFWISKRLQKK